MDIRIFLIMFILLVVSAKKKYNCNQHMFHTLFINNIFKYNRLTNRFCYIRHNSYLQSTLPYKNMDVDSSFIVAYVTTPSKDVAENISNILLKEKLVSCVNIVPGILSMYHWKGEIAKDNEVLMMIKTKKKLFGEIVNCVKKHHPYEIPEVIAVPIIHGSKDYLDWVSNSVKLENDENKT
ncbi:protein CutA, putative [Hepatocystis sp. ex Piliocolobus tephrosceles]|uniref:Divalent-cation tolerance protein CutA-like n=2 Tax=Piliocolobus tephrosceles TaxID=591936 RepID=A0A8C9LLR7_9PRIM|nr:protein CutA, putative [Hepatocystis sp. ex Piliocolobus tephrosceles]